MAGGAIGVAIELRRMADYLRGLKIAERGKAFGMPTAVIDGNGRVQQPKSFAQFEKAVAKLRFMLGCHLVAGDFDYFLKIRVGDMADFNRIHGEQLIALPGAAFSEIDTCACNSWIEH